MSQSVDRTSSSGGASDLNNYCAGKNLSKTMYVHKLSRYQHTHTHTRTHARTHARTHTHTHTHTRTHTHLHAYTHTTNLDVTYTHIVTVYAHSHTQVHMKLNTAGIRVISKSHPKRTLEPHE